MARGYRLRRISVSENGGGNAAQRQANNCGRQVCGVTGEAARHRGVMAQSLAFHHCWWWRRRHRVARIIAAGANGGRHLGRE